MDDHGAVENKSNFEQLFSLQGVSATTFRIENEAFMEVDWVKKVMKDHNLQDEDNDFYAAIELKSANNNPPNLRVIMTSGKGTNDVELMVLYVTRSDLVRLASFIKGILAVWPRDESDNIDEEKVFGK